MVLFILILIFAGVLLYFLPRILPMDASVMNLIRAVVIIFLVLLSLDAFGVTNIGIYPDVLHDRPATRL